MANKCRINRSNGKSVPDGADLRQFASDNIIPSLKAIYSNKDYYNNGKISPQKMRMATISFLQTLGESYAASDHKYIVLALAEVLNRPFYRVFNLITPIGTIANFLKHKGTAEQASSQIFTDQIMGDDIKDTDAPDYFLHNAYGQAISAKMKLQRKMNNVVLNSFIIDRENGEVVSDINQALVKIDFYKRKLFKDIQDYFITHSIKSTITTVDVANTPIDKLMGHYSHFISEYLQVGLLSGNELQSLYDDAYNNNVTEDVKNKALTKLEAYGSWLALLHFDNFIKMTVGDTIVINPSSVNRYEYSTKGTNINTTWRKDDNIDLQAEINKLTQALINTSPMMQFGSTTPISGSYMQFSDFSYMTAKIKDLVYDSTASSFFVDSKPNIFNSLTEDEKILVKNKSLRLIISNSRQNPQKYIPIIYKVLNASENNIPIIKQFKNFNTQDLNILWSIYKNMYDSNPNGMGGSWHSLYAIQKINPDSKNYYAAVSSVADCIFSVNFAQYYFEDGVLKLRTLRDAAVDKTLRELTTVINTKNSNDLLGTFDFDSYDVKEIKTDDRFDGISFKLPLNSGEDVWIHVKNMGELITFSKSSLPTGLVLSQLEIKELNNESSIKKFFEDALGLNLIYNADFRKTYQELTTENGDNITPYIKNILNLSSHVFFNRYIAQKYINARPYKMGKIETIKELFLDEAKRPKFNSNFFNMEMVPKSKLPMLRTIAQALGTTRGVNSSRQVKDSDNAMLSSQTLSRLLGNMTQLFETQINAYNTIRNLENKIIELENQLNQESSSPFTSEFVLKDIQGKILDLKNQIQSIKDTSYVMDTTQNPAGSHFSLITNPHLFKGMIKSEEIKGVYGSKKQVKFTTAEAVISSFLHNFVLGHCNMDVLDKHSELGGGIVGLLPSVNSDKTTVSIAKFDLNAKIGNSQMTYMQLDNPGIQDLIMDEIGGFYTTMYNNIKEDFNLIANYVGVPINPDNNFLELNTYADLQGKSASDLLFDWTKKYNQANPTKPIRLIDLVHFIKKGSHITFNNTTRDLMERFSDVNKTKEFFNLKNTEVLKSALDSEFVINLYGNSNLDNQPEVNYLRANYGDWINDSGLMILAQININGVNYKIANKNDLLALEKQLTLDRMAAMGIADYINKYNLNTQYYKELCGFDKLSTKIHLLKDKITLHPMLEKYNLFDYLFTQQLMSSTVGSHIAHPAKGSFNRLVDDKQLISDGYFKSSFGITTKLEFVNHLNTTRTSPVAARWSPLDKNSNESGVILLNVDIIRQKYNEKAWINPPKLADDSRATALPIDTFTSYEEWLTFILEHESAHRHNRKHQGESIGAYETRINNIALQALNFRKQQALLAEEASRFYALHKRNVSFTAAMDQFQLNLIDGIPLWYNIAVIDDIKEGLFTVDGNTDEAKPYDGATYVNPITMYLENNSLNEARAGIDKKQFVHFYDELTGSGGIIKTAGFAVTNDRMRNSIFYRNMMYNMTNRVWKDYQGNDYVTDITKNFKNQNVEYGTFYFKLGNKYYEASILKATVGLIRQLNLTTSSGIENDPSVLDDTDLANGYIKVVTEITLDGNVISEPKPQLEENINTNYKLWEMFGGMHSLEFNGGILQPSETSLQMVVKAVINTGQLKPTYVDGDITAEHVDQPLKNADIHYMPTIGAVKLGAANMNPNAYYGGRLDLNFFKIRMTNAGIQLDKEHHADGSTLSLMTQVISSACSMGFNPEQADRLYKALYSLTLQGIKEFKEGFKEILNSNDPSKFETAIADCMIKSMLTSTALDGDMLRAIASELIKKAREGKELTFADTKTFPYSDPAVFTKLVTNLSVMMTKAGIKAKMNGILSVLCPTNGIVKMYNFTDSTGTRHHFTLSLLEEFYGDDYNNIIDKIQFDQPNIDFSDFTNIEVGTKYLVKLVGGYKVFDVKYPHDTRVNGGLKQIINDEGVLENIPEEIIGYLAFKDLIQSGKVISVKEFIKDGKELGTINYKFKGTDGKSYQIWDINYILDLFGTITKVKKLKTDEDKLNLYLELIAKYDDGLDTFNQSVQDHFLSYKNGGNLDASHMLKLAKVYAKKLQLDILFALSKNNPGKIKPFKIGNIFVLVDKESIQTLAYEIVMPKVFLEEFGLDLYANLDEIVNNPDYFYDRMVRNFDTIILDETLYDLELKRTNGQHIYLKDKAEIQDDWYNEVEQVTIHKKVDELGKIWRIDPTTNKKMYLLYSMHDLVYRIPGTNTEIILTSSDTNDKNKLQSGLTFYLNNFKYQSIHISEAIAPGSRGALNVNQRPLFDDVLNIISKSKNKTAQSWYDIFKTDNSLVDDRIDLNRALNDFNELDTRLKQHLREQATIMHTSFKKSLDIIAARIPAQNQQSFMPMKVVSFDNPNINTAYVSVMQFFLQGSDLDIDAVSLLTHSFSKNGEFHDWSPDFDMSNVEMLNLSMNLPFPSGQELEIVAYDSTPEHVNLLDQRPLLTDNEDYKWLVAEATRLNSLTPETTDILVEERLKKVALQRYINLLKFIEKEKGIIYLAKKSELEDKSIKMIINRINKHNTYLKGVSDDVVEGAIKNYVVGSLYSISIDSANLLEAHTGVDVATNPLKKIANESELSEVQKTFTPGNVFNKYQAIEEASVGKDDIAICATGLKAFFAATQFCNSFLNENLQDESMTSSDFDAISEIIKFNPITIGGRTFSTLANIRVDDLLKVNPLSEIYSILKDKGFDEDASVIMSALLSLSTDNAKELCLAKINAGTGMLGMYLYGAAIGMDFDVMNKIIASPLGFTVAKLLNSNEFTRKQGKTSVDSALSYLFDGPRLNELSPFNMYISKDITTFNVFETALKLVLSDPNNSFYLSKLIETTGNEDIINTLSISNLGNVLSKLTRKFGAKPALNLLYLVRKNLNTTMANASFTNLFEDLPNKLKGFTSLSNLLCDFFNEFVGQAETLRNTKYISVYGESDIKDDLNKLALGADEFKRLGQFLRLNQEIKTKPDELINFVLKIENCIVERAKLIKRVNGRLGIQNEVSDEIEVIDFKRFAESFISDPDNPGAYHNQQIELYEKHCKTCVNPLRILTTVPHYKGYLESMILAYEGDYFKSVKFRAIKLLGNKFITNTKITRATDKTAVYKGVLSFVDDYMNNAYLRTLTFKLPASTSTRTVSIVSKSDSAVNTKEGEPVALGTEFGNKTFEKFFEEVFIPELKKSNFGRNNIFVQGLEDVLVTDSVTGLRYLAKSLTINMLPSSENERVLLGQYRNDFNKLAGHSISIGRLTYSIVLMFQFYNLLKFKGKGGRSSLLSIFEDVMANQNEYLVDYRTFINEFDSTYDFAIGYPENQISDTGKYIIGIDEEIIYKYLAPLGNPQTATSKIIKYKDLNTGETILLKKIEKELSSLNYDDYGDSNPYGDFEYEEGSDGMDGLGLGYEAEFYGTNYDEYNPNYGDYELFNGSGVLSRFDNYTSIQTQDTLPSFKAGEYSVKNVVISNGYLKSFVHDGKTYTINSVKKVTKFVKEQNKPALEVLDENILKSIIEQTFC